MADVQQIYRVSDTLGSFLGIAINALVLYIIKQTYSKKIAAYSRMLVVSATYSILYGVVEFVTQHELFMKDGILFCIPKGLEKYLSRSLYPVFLFPHVCLSCLGLYILPSNYQYEYALLTDPTSVSITVLIRNIIVSTVASSIGALLSIFAARAARTKPEPHYMDMISDDWLTEGDKTYMIPMDSRDLATQMYFGTVGVMSSFFCVAALYYVWKIRQFLQQNTKKSRKTKRLEDQFTRVVIIQGANTFFFAFIPLSVVSLGTLSHVRLETMGLLVMIPLSWLPVANGLYTLLAIRKYREYFFNMFKDRKIGTEQKMVSTVTGQTDGNEDEDEDNEQSH